VSEPFRMDVSWREWYYEPGPAPGGLRVGDSLRVREDRLTASDIEAAKAAIAEATGGALVDEELEFYARTALTPAFTTAAGIAPHGRHSE
jgi:hypothetical protein